MPIRYSSVVGGSSSTGFNLDVGASGNTTFYFDTPQPAGGYSITSQLADSSIEFYAIAEDGTLSGYTNTKALSATKDFDTLVVYGATTNDLITFEYKSTTLPTASGDQDSGAAPFITSVSDADLANIDDTTIITGGNFATDVVVTFTGTDSVVRNAKSVVRTDSAQLIITRPDEFLEDNSPYTLTVSNPGITQSAIVTNTSPITAGGDPVWVTAAGALAGATGGTPYSATLSATDPDGGTITYFVVTGQLPSGLSLNSSTGVISGTPTGGTQSFTIAATDSSGNITNRAFSVSVVLAAGGTITDSGGYRYHTFSSSGTLTTYADLNADVLVVAGGGGGGAWVGGGGGAGGMLAQSITVPASSHVVTVGAGGNGVYNPGDMANLTSSANSGVNSSLGSLMTSFGGGFGGAWETFPAASGGSGGGDGYSYNGGAGTPGQGNKGGAGRGTADNGYPTGGGGGAGTPGQDWSSSKSGDGGAGLQWLNGNYYAGGGGGGVHGSSSNAAAGSGGLGGGGNGVVDTSTQAQSGSANTGGGGGGAGRTGGSVSRGGNGGSGIVIIRYPI